MLPGYHISIKFVLESKVKRLTDFVIGRLEKEYEYYPVCTESIAIRSEWNNWFICGWQVYTMIIIISIFIVQIACVEHFLGLVAL